MTLSKLARDMLDVINERLKNSQKREFDMVTQIEKLTKERDEARALVRRAFQSWTRRSGDAVEYYKTLDAMMAWEKKE